MGEAIFYSGIIISIVATIGWGAYSATQIKVQKEVKNIPMKFDEWKAGFRRKRFYFLLAQLGGLLIAFIGLLL